MKDTESPAYKWARRQEKIPTELEQLREQVATLTKERDCAYQGSEAQTQEQLAAAQATIERLREALEAVETTCSYNGQEDEIGEHSCCHEPSYRPHSPDCWTHLRTKALALPNDTTALDARLAQERTEIADTCDCFHERGMTPAECAAHIRSMT